MIRVFKPTDRDFTSNGDAVIVPIKARVKNNMNGEFFIELTCESKFYKYLDQGNIIITPTPQGEQAFRIDNQLSRKGERITIKARHVFYDAEKLVVADSYAVDLNCEQALKHFNAATDSTSPFTMHSDITSLNSFRCVRKSLAEAIGTVIERWGGYLVRNNWDISVNKSVGRDYGVTIRYAKNLKELTASYDFSGVATKLLPVGKDGILLPELYVSSSKQYSIPYTKVVSIQQDINEDDYSTEEEYQAAVIADLRTQAQALVNKTCIPVITYTLKGNPEKVQDIGDVIEVIDERIGVNITTQVIGYEWDIMTESYANLTFGNFGNTLSGLMATVNSNTKGIVNEAVGEVKTEIKKDIVKLYELLQGSYVVYRGYDILLLDRIPAGTAQNVIKFSKDGISVSSNGINGKFTEVYNISTKKLSVPAISLNGKDLQTTLDAKISYDNLKAGNNITITRKGKIITINSTGGDSGIRLYYGADIPANSFGSNKDIYIQLDTAMANLLAFDASNSGTSITNYTATENNRKWDITATFLDNWEYHSFNIYSLQNLTVGKNYTISFDFQNDGIPPLYGVGELFGLTLQHSNRFIDMRNWSSDLVENGEFKYFEDSYYGEWWYQSFPNDTKRVHYEFEFTARQITEYIGFYGDRTSGNLTCSLYELCVGEREEANEIKDVFYKINGEWLLYEAYESGDNITIVDGVISATDTDEIAELEDVSLTNLADGEILKYNATTQKWENAEDSGGSEVEANPSGTATDTLTKLGIDGTVYKIQGGGGGVGGSSVYSEKVLYKASDNTFTNIQVDFTEDYDAYIFYCNDTIIQKAESYFYVKSEIKDAIANNRLISMYPYGSDGYCQYYISNSGLTTLTNSAGFFIYKIVGLKFGTLSPIIYSEEEREVGVWKNNKPLYQKTIVIDNVPSGSGTFDIYTLDSDIENVVNHISFMNSGVYTRFVPYVDVGNYDMNIYFNLPTIKLVVDNYNWAGYTLYITIQYTKTTDVAGSAQYTTLGVPAHHYDGNEKVVGTWFGETLYENYIDLGSATTITPNGVQINIGSIDVKQPVNAFGIYDLAIAEAQTMPLLWWKYNGNMYFSNSTQGACNKLILQYTKTT